MMIRTNFDGSYNNKLRIGVIGYNSKIVQYTVLPQIKDLELANGQRVGRFAKGSFFTDDCEYFVLNGNEDRLRGFYLDQLIIADDRRWDVLYNQASLIDKARALLICSDVPSEHQIIKLQLD